MAAAAAAAALALLLVACTAMTVNGAALHQKGDEELLGGLVEKLVNVLRREHEEAKLMSMSDEAFEKFADRLMTGLYMIQGQVRLVTKEIGMPVSQDDSDMLDLLDSQFTTIIRLQDRLRDAQKSTERAEIIEIVKPIEECIAEWENLADTKFADLILQAAGRAPPKFADIPADDGGLSTDAELLAGLEAKYKNGKRLVLRRREQAAEDEQR